MILIIIIGISFFWLILTLWVQYGGVQKVSFIGNKDASQKALIIYNPDPIYNLDEQVCNSFAEGLSKHGFLSKISTIQHAEIDTYDYHLYVFCANTYNWAPDWPTTNYINNHTNLSKKNVVAITLGSGSTSRAKQLLEETIIAKNSNLLDSKTYWLMRPNDDNRLEEKNTEVASGMAKALGNSIGKQLATSN